MSPKEPNPLQIVVDTNVLVAALKSREGASFRLLSLTGDPRWRLNVSTPLLLEYEEQARCLIEGSHCTSQTVDNILDFVAAEARQRHVRGQWQPQLQDPDDEIILELGIECAADFVISFNKRDLAPCERFGIKVLTPGEFLNWIGVTR